MLLVMLKRLWNYFFPKEYNPYQNEENIINIFKSNYKDLMNYSFQVITNKGVIKKLPITKIDRSLYKIKFSSNAPKGEYIVKVIKLYNQYGQLMIIHEFNQLIPIHNDDSIYYITYEVIMSLKRDENVLQTG